MGYYPTSEVVVGRVGALLSPFCRDDGELKPIVLDPCCGEGEIKRYFKDTNRHDMEFYGVELDEYRFSKAEDVMDQCFQGDALNDVIRDDGFASVLFLNPPYNNDHEGHRLESRFLSAYRSALCEKGILVYIVPDYIIDKDLAKHILSAYEEVRVYRYDDSEYDQVIVLGVKRKRLISVEDDEVQWLLDRIQNIRPGYFQFGKYDIAPRPKKHQNPRFHRKGVDPLALERDLAQSRAYDRLRASITISENELRRPPCELHTGHLGLLLASGCIDGLVGEGTNAHLVKARCIKKQSKEDSYDDDGNPITVTKETYQTSLKILTPSGDLKSVGSHDKITSTDVD
jgi:SAM-dependent methyltransferase